MSSIPKSPKIFLLNGAKLSGKDTGGGWLAAKYGTVVKFAEPIKRAVTAVYHAGNRDEFDKYDTPELKDLPQDIYFGKSCREVQISVSETWLKKFHNDDRIFGKFLIKDIERRQDMPNLLSRRNYFVTDSGFAPEAEALIEKYGAGNVFLARIHCPGCNFTGDSRSYINLDAYGIRTRDIQNSKEPGGLNTYLENLDAFVKSCYDIEPGFI